MRASDIFIGRPIMHAMVLCVCPSVLPALRLSVLCLSIQRHPFLYNISKSFTAIYLKLGIQLPHRPPRTSIDWSHDMNVKVSEGTGVKFCFPKYLKKFQTSQLETWQKVQKDCEDDGLDERAKSYKITFDTITPRYQPDPWCSHSPYLQ